MSRIKDIDETSYTEDLKVLVDSDSLDAPRAFKLSNLDISGSGGGGGTGNVIDMTLTDGIKVLDASTDATPKPYQLKYDSFISVGSAYSVDSKTNVHVSTNENGPWTQIGRYIYTGYLGCFAKGTWVKSDVAGVVVLPLKQSGGGGSIVSGGGSLPFYDWEKIDDVNYGSNVTLKAGESRTLECDCVLAFEFGSSASANYVTINDVVISTVYGIYSLHSTNLTTFTGTFFYLKKGDVIRNIHTADVVFALFPLKQTSGSVSGSGLIDVDKIDTLQSEEFNYADKKDIVLQYDSRIQIQLQANYEGYELIKVWVKKGDLYLYLGQFNEMNISTLKFKSGTTLRIYNISYYTDVQG